MKRWLLAIVLMGLLHAAVPTAAFGATIRPDTLADEPGADPDNGNCTLREAVISANENTSEDGCAAGDGADLIQLRAGTYELSVPGGDPMPGSSEVDARFGDLDLGEAGSGRLTIRGHKRGTTIDGDRVDRVFHLHGTRATLRDLTITRGQTEFNYGGGVQAVEGAVLRVVDSTIANNLALGGGNAGGGGGAYVGAGAKVTLIRTTVAENGGLFSGGLEVSDATLVIRDSVVRDNAAEEGPGGIYSASGTLDLTSSKVLSNQAGTDGGGIRVLSSVATITDSRVVGNHAFTEGGGISIGHGGEVMIERSEIAGNTANDDGGGLEAGDNGVAKLAFDLVNSTVSGNTADADESDVGNGGGLSLGRTNFEGGHIRVRSSTIAGNHADIGGGILGRSGDGEPALIKGTLVAGNTHANFNPITFSADCIGDLVSEGHNLFENAHVSPFECDLATKASDKFGVNPRLGPLAHNGGPTRTHVIARRSPAVNAVPKKGAPKTDQRGMPRAKPDIGAYERAVCSGTLVNVVGTNRADRLRGAPGKDGIAGLGGGDVINGRGGSDAICAGGGADRVNGGAGKDRLFGQGGRDRVSGGGGRGDLCHGGPGRDSAGPGCERVRSIP